MSLEKQRFIKRPRTTNRPRTAQIPKTSHRKKKRTSPLTTKQNKVYSPTDKSRGYLLTKTSNNFLYNRPVSVNCIIGDSGRIALRGYRPQSSYCPTYKRMHNDKYLSPYTSKENERIKRKMEEYVKVSRNTKERKVVSGITYKELKERFDFFAMRIDSMLANEVTIENIHIHENYRMRIGTGMKRQFKLWSKLKTIPLRIKITMEKGIGKLMFSQENSRPTLDNYDKLVPLLGKDLIESYTPNKEAENRFVEDNIYITIEADKEIFLIFQCVFGNGKCWSLINSSV